MWGLGLGVGVVGWWCVLVVVLVVLWGGSGFVGWYWVVIGSLGWLVGGVRLLFGRFWLGWGCVGWFWCWLDIWWGDGGCGWLLRSYGGGWYGWRWDGFRWCG